MAVLELDKDNLDEHMHYKDLIVVFSSKTCGACKRIRPHLWELDEKYQVIILDVTKFCFVTKFMDICVRFKLYFWAIFLYSKTAFSACLLEYLVPILSNNVILAFSGLLPFKYLPVNTPKPRGE